MNSRRDTISHCQGLLQTLQQARIGCEKSLDDFIDQNKLAYERYQTLPADIEEAKVTAIQAAEEYKQFILSAVNNLGLNSENLELLAIKIRDLQLLVTQTPQKILEMQVEFKKLQDQLEPFLKKNQADFLAIKTQEIQTKSELQQLISQYGHIEVLLAIQNKSYQFAEDLLATGHVDIAQSVDLPQYSGIPLLQAAMRLYDKKDSSVLKIIKLLIIQVADINQTAGPKKLTALHCAVEVGCLECIEFLVKTKGANVNVKDIDEKTPLMMLRSNLSISDQDMLPMAKLLKPAEGFTQSTPSASRTWLPKFLTKLPPDAPAAHSTANQNTSVEKKN